MKKAQTRLPHAFTLIELLVVISIIALLVSILMPSLNKAREMAKMTVCLSNCKQAGNALQMYTGENEDWLPGPNTSGLSIASGNMAKVNSSSSAPVQNTDWMSPTMGKMLSLPEDREKRFIQLSNHDFSCPSNKVFYDYEYSGPFITSVPIQTVKQVSYSASLAFLTYSSSKGGDNIVTDSEYANGMVPSNYSPKFNKVGRPSEKVFMMEGSRYLSSDMQISLNALDYQNDGGNYAMYGPATPIISSSGGDPFLIEVDAVGKGEWKATLQEGAEKYTYRHSNKRMNQTFFDGHSESVTFEESLNLRRYWPKGSSFIAGDETNDPYVQSKSDFKIK